MAVDILVVDDEQDIRNLIAGILKDDGYMPRVAANSDAVFAAFKERVPSLVILDIWLQGSMLDGLEILSELRKIHPELPILIISGHANVEMAVAAIKKGAYDFIEKPFNAEKLMLTVQRALEAQQLRDEVGDLRARTTAQFDLVGKSTIMQQLRGLVERIANTRSRVLITGPAGAGKEAIARNIHTQSTHAQRPFIVVRAAAILPENMERELFGVEGKDGKPSLIGHLERAHGGTLVFEEIGDMRLDTQSKILRVLVDQRFTRVGGAAPVTVNVRIVSTTTKDLQNACEKNEFRADLYHRLNVVTVAAPPLSTRREDIPELARYFIEEVGHHLGGRKPAFSDEALTALQLYAWPGNVRQLRNVIERTLILHGDRENVRIEVEDLPNEILNTGPVLTVYNSLEQAISLPLREAREKFEREYLIAQINRFGGNISRTSNFIGMERSALYRKLKSLGVVSQHRHENISV